jgi:ABC-type branched-subunit amino acid transport system ATPase component
VHHLSIIGEIVATLQSLRAEHNLRCLLVEQAWQFIASLADRVLIIQNGTATCEMKPQEMTIRTCTRIRRHGQRARIAKHGGQAWSYVVQPPNS